jgi:proline iminopeptidase
MVSDTVAVTEYLIDRFGVDGVYLVGQSWGSGLGALAAKARPDLYHAFVGVGQMVSWDDTDRMFWEDTLAWAERTGNTGLAERLRSDGPPPYDDIRKYGPITSAEHDWNPYPGFDPNNEMPAILFVPEYSVIERVNAFRGFFDVATVLYPQLAGLDFRLHIPALQVPYYMVLGEHEARGRVVPAEEWLVMLEAPYKEKVVFSGAGHRANFDRPAEFAGLMRTVAGRHSGS